VVFGISTVEELEALALAVRQLAAADTRSNSTRGDTALIVKPLV